MFSSLCFVKVVLTCSRHVLHPIQEFGVRQNLPRFLSLFCPHLAVQLLPALQLEQQAQPDQHFSCRFCQPTSHLTPLRRSSDHWSPVYRQLNVRTFAPTPNTTCTLLLINMSTERMGLTSQQAQLRNSLIHIIFSLAPKMTQHVSSSISERQLFL